LIRATPEIHLLKIRKSDFDFLAFEEVDQFLAAARAHVPDWFAFMLVALRTGLRVGEMFGLRWCDVGFERRRLRVAESYSQLPEDHAQRYAPTNSGPRFDFRFFNGASLGLTVPYLRGDEVLTTKGLTPAGELALRLPGDRPQPLARYRTRPLTMEVVPHTVAVLVEERQVFMVWRASAVLPGDFTVPTPSPMQPDITGLEEFELAWA
jgi:hypothetical protein